MKALWYLLTTVLGAIGALATLRSIEQLIFGGGQGPMIVPLSMGALCLYGAWRSLQRARGGPAHRNGPNMKRVAGIGCFLLASLGFVSALRIVSKGPSLWDPSGSALGQAVGAFLVPIGLLMLGLKLVQQSKGLKPSSSQPEPPLSSGQSKP